MVQPLQVRNLAGILALIIGIAGWYYLFYSRAASKLAGIEETANNLRRARLRRINGILMLLLASLLYAGFYVVDDHDSPQAYVVVWISISILLLLIVWLAVIDLRLTANLRRKH
jgi:drug/metabolite transporter (DMT)-like permease